MLIDILLTSNNVVMIEMIIGFINNLIYAPKRITKQSNLKNELIELKITQVLKVLNISYIEILQIYSYIKAFIKYLQRHET